MSLHVHLVVAHVSRKHISGRVNGKLRLLQKAITHVLLTVTHHAWYCHHRLLALAIHVIRLHLQLLEIDTSIKLIGVSTHHNLRQVHHLRLLS